ncbi:OmpA/MotB domain-containing protein [Vibrio ichthyoenteri ATCC 700023]|uniref:OmpA/MotB domain-containing protein n=1 Tax=Vibrio ichthyoenteri ATCC 700023 TaxID=870968 RepID=F9S7S5_9VIBR|nr:porin family protein [Vibrio ichthyoenteri]EGU30975.1 OmpA/MotB domain-containing protein [Vibrio ichthyoenteri ATCC 700023]
MKTFIAASALLLSTAALADVNPALTLKGGYQFSTDIPLGNSSPTGGIWGVSGELLLTDALGIELGYQHHGKLSANQISVENQFIDSKLTYQYLINEAFYTYGKLGVAYWQSDRSDKGVNESFDGFSPIFEAGLGYYFTPHVRASMGYQYIGQIDNDVYGSYGSHSIMVNLSFLFKPYYAPAKNPSMPVELRAFSFEIKNDKTSLSASQLNELLYLTNHTPFKSIEVSSANALAVYDVIKILSENGITPSALKPILNSPDTHSVTIKLIL